MHKVGIPTFKVRYSFALPANNRYFNRVEKNSNVISQSLSDLSQ